VLKFGLQAVGGCRMTKRCVPAGPRQ